MSDFLAPVGSAYVVLAIVLLNIILLSFLGSIFINKLRLMWQNLSALSRKQVIKLKN